jgi:Major capsid protein GP7
MRFLMCIALIVVAVFATDISAATAIAHASPVDWGFWLGVTALGMAALGTGNLTLADQAKRLDPTGKVSTIVELLNQSNEILDDMVWKEGNLETGHRTTVRTGLPAVAWRLLNQGVVPSKSTTAQIDEQAGMLEAWSEVDKDLVLLNGNTAQVRLSEARAFIEAMNQEMAQTLFYGNAGLAAEEFTGLSPRYSLSTATNGTNVIKGGSVDTDNTSAWLVAWGDETVSGIFPKGSKAGLIHEDYGEVTVEMIAGLPGARMRAFQERWQWKGGIAVKDWRYVVRVCNLDVSLMNGGVTVDLISLMEQAEETIPNRLGKPVWYMNRTVRRYLRKLARTQVANGGGLTFENYQGKRVLMFGETPIRTVDQLLNTEALVA